MAMRQKNGFNFEREVERLQCRILFEPEYLDQVSLKREETIEEELVHRKAHVLSKEQEKARTKKESSLAAHIETEEVILYALCSINRIESKLSLILLKKNNERQSCKELAKVEVQVTSIRFAIDSNENICLLVGAKCGSLFLYKNFETQTITVSRLKFSANELTFILLPSWYNFAFILSKVGTIYLLNYIEQMVYYQFKCPLPLIQDPRPRLILDEGETFLGHVFSYGRILVWEISEQIKRNVLSLNIDEGESLETPPNSLKIRKKIIFRPKMSIASSVVHGLTWADFLGIFIATINPNGELRIIAVSINDCSETQEFYTVISKFETCKNIIEGKYKIAESVADAVILQDNSGIVLAKNIEFSNCGKRYKSLCNIERYGLDQNFKVCKIIVVSLSQITLIDQILPSIQLQYLLMRNKGEYEILRTKLLQDKK